MSDFFKRKTPTERKMEEAAMKKKKVDNTKEKYEVDTRGRQFLEKWRKAFEWVEYEQIDTIYGQNGTKVRECTEMIITERKKKKKTEENIVPPYTRDVL